MDIKEYFKKFYGMDPFLFIGREEWDWIKATWDKESILDELALALHSYPFPYERVTDEQLSDEYLKLKGVHWKDVLVNGEWIFRNGKYNRYHNTLNGSHLYFKRLNTGNKVSNMFHQETRWNVDYVRSSSGWKYWQTVKGIRGCLKPFFTLAEGMPQVDAGKIRTAIQLKKYVASQFKPVIAKAFYDYFDSKNVLDFSAGWGDRFAGFYSSPGTQNYVGIDPNTSNHPNYLRQEEFYRRHKTFFEPKKTATFICSPAEDVDYSGWDEYFDTVFTSPPYFDTERYAEEDTQSWKRYPEINSWNTGFLHKTIGKLYPSVKRGGIIAINIADVYMGKKGKYYEIVNPMNEFMESLGMEYLGCMGMEMAKRPNNGGAGTAKSDNFSEDFVEASGTNLPFAEPIWIFKKL